MSENITLTIDGKQVSAKQGMTIVEAAKTIGIDIPTLCNEQRLAPYGACRICTVEISQNNRTRLVASCVYPVEEGLIVKTDTSQVSQTRKMLIELMLASSPTAKKIQELASRYGVKEPRFVAEKTNCILCGQCVRYCQEVKKMNAIGFAGRGTTRRVVFFPEIATTVCASCRECFSLCPTAKLPSETDGVSFENLTLGDFLKVK